jgi:hypothetical protein
MGHAGTGAMRKNVTRARLRRIDQQRGDRRLGRDLDLERLRGGGFQIGNPKLCYRLILHFSCGTRKQTRRLRSGAIPHGKNGTTGEAGFMDRHLMLL